MSWGRLSRVFARLGRVLRRLEGVFEASVGVLAYLVDVLGPSGGHLAGVLGATWDGLGRLRFVLGRAGALRKIMKNN